MGFYKNLEIEIDEAIERAIEEERESRYEKDLEGEGDADLSLPDLLYILCDPIVEYCACEGTGFVPMNNDEDAKCLYHNKLGENNYGW